MHNAQILAKIQYDTLLKIHPAVLRWKVTFK